MKLPENKKERVQMLVLMGIAGVAVLYAAANFGLRPIFKTKKDRKAKIEALATQIKDAQAIRDQTAGDPAMGRQALLKAKEYSDKYLLHPRLGENYFLSVNEIAEQWLKDAGIPKDQTSISEVGKAPVPQSQDPRRVLSVYSLRIGTKCDTRQLIQLIKVIEDSNPFLCISALTITAQTGEPTKHAVQFTVEIPAWIDSDMPSRLEEQIKAGEGRQG